MCMGAVLSIVVGTYLMFVSHSSRDQMDGMMTLIGKMKSLDNVFACIK